MKRFLSSALSILILVPVCAQNVGIGTSTPNINYDLHIVDSAANNLVMIQSVADDRRSFLGLTTSRGSGVTATSSFIRYPATPSSSYSSFPSNDLTVLSSDWGPLLTGTVGSAPIMLMTSLTERMRIDAFGWVGMGTSVPQAPFHIYNSSQEEIQRLDAGQPLLGFYNNGVIGGSVQARNSSFDITSHDGSFNKPIYIKPNNTFSTAFLNNGTVGIGTPLPLTKLNITGGSYNFPSTYGDMMIGSASYSLRFGVSVETSPTVPGRAFIEAMGSGAPGKLYLGHDANPTLFTLDDQKAGIGLINFSAPEAKLHVYSVNASSSNPTLLLDDLTPLQVWRGFQTTGRIGTSGSTFYMETASGFQNISFRPGGIPTMTLAGASVGIGTVIPSTIFDVYTNADIWHQFIGGATGRLQIGGQTGNGAVIQSLNPSNALARDLYLQRDGGNVSIGNSNPLAKFHITGNQQLDYTSGISPHLLLQQTDAGYARLGFGNTNGRSWTIAAIRTGAAVNDQLNFFSEQTGADRFILYGNGNAWLAGTLTQASDSRLKKNIEPIRNVLSSLDQLNGYHYYWKDESKGREKQIGLLAQEVEQVFPELVHTDANGNKSVAYQNLVPVLLEAIKELKKEVNELKQLQRN